MAQEGLLAFLPWPVSPPDHPGRLHTPCREAQGGRLAARFCGMQRGLLSPTSDHLAEVVGSPDWGVGSGNGLACVFLFLVGSVCSMGMSQQYLVASSLSAWGREERKREGRGPGKAGDWRFPRRGSERALKRTELGIGEVESGGGKCW